MTQGQALICATLLHLIQEVLAWKSVAGGTIVHMAVAGAMAVGAASASGVMAGAIVEAGAMSGDIVAGTAVAGVIVGGVSMEGQILDGTRVSGASPGQRRHGGLQMRYLRLKASELPLHHGTLLWHSGSL